jgi:hypothetical protein
VSDQTYAEAVQATRLQGTEDALLEKVARVVDLYQRRQFAISYPSETYDELTNAYDAYLRVRCLACIERMPTTTSPLNPCPEHNQQRL